MTTGFVDGDRDLPRPWTGFTQFATLNETPPKGGSWSRETSQTWKRQPGPNETWPGVWSNRLFLLKLLRLEIVIDYFRHVSFLFPLRMSPVQWWWGRTECGPEWWNGIPCCQCGVKKSYAQAVASGKIQHVTNSYVNPGTSMEAK